MDQALSNWFHIDNIEQLDSPALVIYSSRVKKNIQTLLSMIDDAARVRPHVKTHKTKEITQLLINAGVLKFKCATIAEAEMLALAGAPDVLLAYQPVGPKIIRFLLLIEAYPFTKFSCLVDNQHSAEEMSLIFSEHGLNVPVYIDLNTGMNRTGISAGDAAFDLFLTCNNMKGIRPIGFHWYDGHINNAELTIRTQRCNDGYAALHNMLDKLAAAGHPDLIVIAGGSTTFPIHSKRAKIECSPGTFVFWDKGYVDTCAEQDFLPAALLVARVISKPAVNRLCLDLGHKSVAAENELTKRVFFINAPGLTAVGHSEEHLVMEADVGHTFQIGDVLYGLPYHICPSVALYERAIVIENGRITGEWKIIARDRKISV